MNQIPHTTGKKVLFITTKNTDYIRNRQEIRLLSQDAASLDVIGSTAGNYAGRLFHVYRKLLTTDFSQYDTIFIGFAPQLVLPLFYKKIKSSLQFAHSSKSLLRNKYTRSNNQSHADSRQQPTHDSKVIVIDFFISLFDTFCNDRKVFKPTGPIGRFLHHLDQKTLALADEIICDTACHKEYFHSEFSADKNHLHALYLNADTDIYHPMKVTKPFELTNRFVVLYFGSILPLQGVDTVLHAYDRLKNDSRLMLIFIGPLKKNSLLPKGDNIKYYKWLSQAQLAKCIAMADLCLAGHFHPTIEKAKRTIPGKAFIYQAMGKPMILGDTPANHELFDENNPQVYFTKLGDAGALAELILNIASPLPAHHSLRQMQEIDAPDKSMPAHKAHPF